VFNLFERWPPAAFILFQLGVIMKTMNRIDTKEVYAWVAGACFLDTERYNLTRISAFNKSNFEQLIHHYYTVVCEYLIEGTASQGPWEDYEHDLCMRAKRLFK
jgi:hypothetical protein